MAVFYHLPSLESMGGLPGNRPQPDACRGQGLGDTERAAHGPGLHVFRRRPTLEGTRLQPIA